MPPPFFLRSRVFSPPTATVDWQLVTARDPGKVQDAAAFYGPPKAPFTLSLLGGIDLRGDGGVDTDSLLVNGKAVGLLALLAVPSVGRYLRRDIVAALLWPELDQAHGRSALRKVIHAARKTLGAEGIVSRGDEDISLSPGVVWCDVDAFTRLADGGFLLQALQLFRGELMPGFHLAECLEFDRWLEDERAAARERAAAVAWTLAQRFESDEHFSDAAGMARRSVRFSWSDERALRRALGMLERVGDRAGALRLFDEFARRLKVDFDADPSAETLAVVARLRATG